MTEKQDPNTKEIEELQKRLNELKLKTETKTDTRSSNNAVKIIGIIGAVIIILACLSTLGFGTYKYNKGNSNNESSSSDEQQSSSYKATNDPLGNKEQKRKPSNVNNSSTTTDAPSYDGVEDTPEDKYLNTEDFKFKFQVADTSRYSIVEEWSEVAEKEYSILTYCYELNDTSFDEDWTCGTGRVGIFFISVFDANQWPEYQKGPFGKGTTLIGQNNDLYYALENTKGFIPAELEKEVDLIFETVRDSFEITGKLDKI